MHKSSRWLLAGVFLLLPFTTIFAQVTDFKYDSGHSYREVFLTPPPPTDGCPSPMCTYHKMEKWGDDTPIKEFTYRGRNAAQNVLEFMNWRMVFPVGYNKSNPAKYPMIIMLHGSGESGRIWSGNFNYAPTDVRYDNNDANVINGGKEHQIATGWSHLTGLPSGPVTFPGIVMWPQVSYNGAWESGWDNGNLSGNNRMVAQIIEWVIANYDVDPDRISIHGLSNGAKGTWDLASKRPDLFAAILPMSGVGTNYEAQTDVLVTTPVWLFQGGKDINPSPQASVDLINMLQTKGGNPTYTVYPTLGHTTWTTAYAEPNFFPFMLTANKKNIHVFGGDANLCPGGSLKLGVSAGYAAYQWIRDGVGDIPGATTRYYNATQPGTYRVRMTRRPTVAGGSTITSNPVTVGGEASPASLVLTSTGSLQLPIANGLSPAGNLGGVNNIIQLTAPLGYANYTFYNGTTPVQNSSSNTYTFSHNNGVVADAGIYTAKVLMGSGCTSNASNPINVVWTNPQPPSPKLTAAQVVMTATSSTEVKVSWADLPTETGYEVWRVRFGPLSFQPYSLVTVLPANTTSYTDQGLRPENSYRYMVRTIQTGGGATFSDEPTGNATTLPDTSPPTAPTNLIVSNISETEATLTWSPSSDNDLIFKYEVYSGTTLLTTLTGGPQGTPAPVTTTTLSGLTPNTPYSLSVRAIDYNSNYSPFSDPVIATTILQGNGLRFNYYTYIGTMPGVSGDQLLEPQFGNSFDFSQPPVQTGTVDNFNISGATGFQGVADPNNFVYAFDGFIQINAAGTYRFYIDSDEGSRLYINGSLIVNNDGAHTAGTPKSGVTASLAVGKYAIRVTYFEQIGGQSLTVKYNTPGTIDNYGTATVVPNSVLFLSGTMISNYYLVNTPSTDPAQLSAWTTKADGSAGGSAPANFTNPFQYFTIANQPSVTLGTSWTVSGSGSKVIVGNGANPITLTLNAAFAGTMDAKKNAIINVNHATIPTFETLDATSTVNFNIAGTIPNAVYGNVNLQTAGQYIFPMSTTTIQGNLTAAAGATITGIANNLSAVRVGGNVSFANTGNPFSANPLEQFALAFIGGITHTVSFATPVDPAFFALQADFGDNVLFSNSGTRTYTLGSAQGGGLTLKSGSTLNLGANNLVVSGMGTINPNSENGVLGMNNGNLTLTTSSIQNSGIYFSTGANQVNNFTVSAGSNTSISVLSQVNVRSLVTLSGGELHSNSGSLTLLSDAIGTARIGPITNGARITGSITVRRYMEGGLGAVYRYISSPAKNFTVAALQQYIPITGTFTGASTGPGLGSAASMFSYAEPNYLNFPPSGGTNQDTLRRGKGYAIFVREPTNPVTWQVTGTPYQGTIDFNLTPGSASPNDGWNLLGNPYPSSIQWTATSGAGWPVMTNIAPTVYFRYNFGTQFKWIVYRPGITQGNPVQGQQEVVTNGIISSGQAFWVQADVNPALSIAEGAKYTPGGNMEGLTDVLGIRMSSAAYDDFTYVAHDDRGTENYEKRQDAVKPANSFFNLSTRSKDGVSLAINVTPRSFCQKSIALDIENAAAGTYTLNFFGLDNFESPITAVLRDNFTGSSTEIKEGTSYTFTVTANAASAGAGRFVLDESSTVLTNVALKSNSACESNPSITVLAPQPGMQYQALYNGSPVSSSVVSTSADSLILTLDRGVLGFGTHAITLIAGFPNCGMATLDQTVSINVDTLQTPIIHSQSGVLLAIPENADRYQWLIDGNPLSGETEESLADTHATGNYQVAVSVGACTKVSAPFTVTGVEDDPGSLVRVYPNPFRDQIMVTFPEKIREGTAILTTTLGQKVQSVSIAPQDSYNVMLNFSSVEAGVYVLTLGRYRFKVIKTN